MFKDLKIYFNNQKIDYKYKIDEEKLKISITLENNPDFIEIYYDENIYENITVIEKINHEKVNNSKIRYDLSNINLPEINLTIDINEKYFIKTIYKYVNKFIEKTELIDELNVFKAIKKGNKYQKEIKKIIDNIDSKSLSELILDNEDERQRVEEILLNSQLYNKLMKNIKPKELMLLITNYISCERPPKLTQEEFENVVKEAINYEYSLENVWRLGMNYDNLGYNYDLLDDFFVNSKDVWYIGEYISGIDQVNTKNIMEKVINTKDIDFISKIIEDDLIKSNLDEESKELLKSTLNNNEEKILFYRLTYDGEGIYNALKSIISLEAWKELLSSNRFSWLPKPPEYKGNYKSYFTKRGYEEFNKKVLPIISEYLDKNKIYLEKTSKLSSVVYEDEFQVIIKC